jgi:hypothetical protein
VTIGAKVKEVGEGQTVFGARSFDKASAQRWKQIRERCLEALGDASGLDEVQPTEAVLARPTEPFTENTVRAVKKQVAPLKTAEENETLVWDEGSGSFVSAGAAAPPTELSSETEMDPPEPPPLEEVSEEVGPTPEVSVDASGGLTTGAEPGATLSLEHLPSDSLRAAVLNELTKREPVWKGDIGQQNVMTWLLKAAQTSPSSLLKVEAEDDHFYIVVREGCINDIQCFPGSVTFSLGTLIAQTKQVELDQLKEALSVSQSKGMDLGLVLCDMGFLDEDRLAVIRQIRIKFLSKLVMGAKEGNVLCFELPKLPFEVEIETPELLEMVMARSAAYIKGINHKDLGQMRENFKDKYPTKVNPLPADIDLFQLEAKEKVFFEDILDGSYRLKELLGKSNLNITKSLQLIFRLEHLGMLYFSDEGKARAINYSIYTNKVQDFVRTLETATHFQALGLDWVAGHDAVAKAYSVQKEAFSIARFPEAIHDVVAKDLAKILIAVEAAHTTLSNGDARRRYRNKFIGKEKVTVAMMGLIQRGEMARWKGEEKLAQGLFAQARELDPGAQIPK